MLKKLLLNESKGDAQMVLVVIVPLFVLGGLFTFYISTQQSTTAQINLNVDTEASRFNTMAMLNQLNRHVENQEEMINYTIPPHEDDEELKSKLRNSITYVEGNTGFETYRVNLSMSSEDISISSGDTDRLFYQTRSYIASPKTSSTILRVAVPGY